MTRHTPESLKAIVDQVVKLDRESQLPFLFHIPSGNEQQLIDIFTRIRPKDFVFSHHRNLYHAILHGVPTEIIISNIKSGKSMFQYYRNPDFFVSAIIGGTPSIATGVALANKILSSDQHTWCFVTDGIEDSGHFYEAVRYSNGWNLPCTFILEDNQFAVDTHKKERYGPSHQDFDWPRNVLKYEYTRTPGNPHCRTTEKPDISILKQIRQPDSFYFPDPQECLTTLPNSLRKKSYSGSYLQSIKDSMAGLVDAGYYFVGYSLLHGRAGGTINTVDDSHIIETPVAENLMVGLAQGMAMKGLKTMLYFERHDFMLCGGDALINHLSKLNRISQGIFSAPVIIRAVIDDNPLFYSGPTHRQDFTALFRSALEFPVIEPSNPEEMFNAYQFAMKSSQPTMIVERKSLYF